MPLKCCTQFANKFGKLQQWPPDQKRSVFILVPKRNNAKEYSNYCIIEHISHASKVMLKILQGKLQQHVKCELPDVQTGFIKSRWTRDQIANIGWIIEKARETQKNIYFCFMTALKALTVWITTNCEKSLKRRETRPPYLPPKKPVCRSGSNS